MMRSITAIAFASILMMQLGCNQTSEKETMEEEEAVEVEDRFASESIYEIESEWHTHTMDTIMLSQLEGKIPLIAMVFTNCAFACPRMIADLQNIEDQVPEDMKDDVVFVLASFDAERDTPQRLSNYAKENELADNWLLLHADEEDVRLLSMLLNVQYKKQSDGNFAHSNVITLLNTKGAIVERLEGLAVNPAPIVNKIKKMGADNN